MAEKKKKQTAKAKREPRVTEIKANVKSITKENNTPSKNNTEVLSKILICLYAIIALLVINTTVLLLKGEKVGSTNNTTSASGEENVDYDVSMFTSVSADTLGDAVAGSTPKIVYIGRSSCGYCVKFLPALQKAQQEYGYETLYLDITTVTTTEQQDKILAFDNEEGFLNQNFGGTPMVLLMKDGKIVDTWIGYDEYSSYASWLEENGFTKK